MTHESFLKFQETYYDKRWSSQFNQPINKLQLERLVAILQMIQLIPIKEGFQILDLGSGRGWLSSILSNFGCTTGIELSNEAVLLAQERYSFVKFLHGDLFELLPSKEMYDLVVSQEVIEHVEDQSAFVNTVADTLNFGGHFIFTTPNAWVQNHRSQEEHEKWGLQPIENWIDRKQIINLLSPRFEIIKIKSIIDGFGSTGIFRITNSYKLNKLLKFINLSHIFSYIKLYFDCGLHFVVLAKRVT